MDIDQASRVVLAAAAFLSAVSAAGLAAVTHPRFTPHMVLVSFWSAWFGVAMVDLASSSRFDLPVLPDDMIVVNLNASATVAIGGWAALGVRLWHEAHVERKRAVDLIDEVLQ